MGIRFWIYWAGDANDLWAVCVGFSFDAVNANFFPPEVHWYKFCKYCKYLEEQGNSHGVGFCSRRVEEDCGNLLDGGFQFLFMRITSIVLDWAASSLSIYDTNINFIVKADRHLPAL